ncbi:ABC transporter permease [Plantactinospora soyae]|uniref:Peptide/nickel transport system permease protein n=1 Tax=Plantactinospora soyae TaxID=1544732 RepID=A0A927QYW5_9ACTN|nr:ABC transporter permease [Plantactinospora soyae]MBE1489690.1 peptide/nickel transport system permease protein [Plantactinospora soyae]
MTQVVLRRLVSAVIVMWGAASLIFLIIRLAPGGPALVLLGPDAQPEDVAELSARLGLDRSLPEQYLAYLRDVSRLDFGDSYRLGQPAMEAVLGRLPASLELAAAAAVIAVCVGLVLGLIAGYRRGGVVDRVTSALTIGLQAFPTFWVGIMLILLFALVLRVLPSSGVGTPAHLVLPAVTLSLPFTAIVARLTRSSLVEEMDEPYATTARAKGLTDRQVLIGHALRNSLTPVLTVVALQLGALIGGAVVVENVFAWPGLGSLIVSAVNNRDYAVVQAATLTIAGIIVLLNLLADLVTARLDPRIRLGAA